MGRRAQQARDARAQAAAAELNTWKQELPERAARRFGVRADFVEEVLRSSGLVSIHFGTKDEEGAAKLYGARVKYDAPAGYGGIDGDGFVNDWRLPNIRGFRLSFDHASAEVTDLPHTLTAINVMDSRIRTADELGDLRTALVHGDGQESIVVSRQGLGVLAQTIGHSALAQSFEHVDRLVFNKRPPAVDAHFTAA